MLSRVALLRNLGRSGVAGFEPREETGTGLPLVILQGVLDIIGVEMDRALDSEGWDVSDESSIAFRYTSEDFWTWIMASKSMVLVDSSWHAHARRVLGRHIVAENGTSPALLQSPLLGEWTRSLHVSFRISKFNPQQDYYDHYHHHNDDLLPAVCARCPNIRLASFLMPEEIFEQDTLQQNICKGMSEMIVIEEIVFLGRQIENIVTPLAPRLAATQHPTLCTLRFVFQEAPFEIDSATLPPILSTLASLPALRAFHVALSAYEGDKVGDSFAKFPYLSEVSWTRSSSERCSKFAMNHIAIQPSDLCDNSTRESLLRCARHVKLDFSPIAPGSEALPDFQNMISIMISGCCTSHNSGCKVTIQDVRKDTRLHGMTLKSFSHFIRNTKFHRSVEEIIFKTRVYPDGSSPHDRQEIERNIAKDDEELSLALAFYLMPGLRHLSVRIKVQRLDGNPQVEALKQVVVENARKFGGMESTPGVVGYEYLLPRCMKRCEGRGIRFTVNMVDID